MYLKARKRAFLIIIIIIIVITIVIIIIITGFLWSVSLLHAANLQKDYVRPKNDRLYQNGHEKAKSKLYRQLKSKTIPPEDLS